VSEQILGLSPAVLASAHEHPFRYFNSSPEITRLVVMMYVRYPLSLRNVEDLLAERGFDISHKTALVTAPGQCPLPPSRLRSHRRPRRRTGSYIGRHDPDIHHRRR
jgi:putative transposase